MLRVCRVSLFLMLVVTAPTLHAGSTSDNEGCRSGSPGSTSSEGNEQVAVSQGSAGGSSGSSSDRGASGSGSGSYQPFQGNTTAHRFDRAGLALTINEPIPASTLAEGEIRVFVLPNTVDSEAGYHRLDFRMRKLVEYFVYQPQGLHSRFEKVPYNHPSGHDLVVMEVDSQELAGKATPQLKQKVSAWLRTKIKPAPAAVPAA